MSARNLADVLNEHTYWSDGVRDDDGLVADLLANGPAQHQVPCTRCMGLKTHGYELRGKGVAMPARCLSCAGTGTQAVEVIARVVTP